MSRGRPPATRQRVLHYIAKHRPATVMQIVRACQCDRRHLYRILMAEYGPSFRARWHDSGETPCEGIRVALAA